MGFHSERQLHYEDRGYWENGGFACAACIGHEDLRGTVARRADRPCDFCSNVVAYALDEVLAHIASSIEQEYDKPEELLGMQHLKDGEGQRWSIDDILWDEGVEFGNDAVAEHIRAAFGESEWISQFFYAESEPQALVSSWQRYADAVIEGRALEADVPDGEVFSIAPSAVMVELARRIRAAQLTATLTPDASSDLYRSRKWDPADSHYKTGRDLGTSPGWAGGDDGRFNRSGEPIFYGAFAFETLVAEFEDFETVHRCVGVFRPRRAMQVVDVANIRAAPSLFNPSVRDEAGRERRHTIIFLRGFAHAITQFVDRESQDPVVREQERRKYRPMQAVADLLRSGNHGLGSIEGIVFPSSRAPGNNAALFVSHEECGESGDDSARLVMTHALECAGS